MADFIISPKGNLINIAGGFTPQLRSNQIIFGDFYESFASEAEAAAYLQNMAAGLKAAGIAVDLTSDPTLTSISLSSLSLS